LKRSRSWQFCLSWSWLSGLVIGLAAGCGPGQDASRVYGAAGEPLPGLDSALIVRFERGRSLFHYPFLPEQGLGPLFNQQRCSSCHDLPTLGGFGAETVMKAVSWDPVSGRCDLLADQGGDMVQSQATPLLQAAGIEREAIPARTTHIAFTRAPALYGLGLVESIPESAILERADSADVDGDGISGRVGRTADGRAGRFGRRGEFATLREFIANAALLEMGLTSSLHGAEELVNGQPLPPGVDPVPEPELSDESLAVLVDFITLLAVPARERVSGAAADTVRRGERAFRDAGCGACHVPELPAGPGALDAIERGPVPLWSDLLLHDLGEDVAGVCGRSAGPGEYRTAPLMGLRLRQPYMHDGRADDIERALGMHGGEAERSRDAYVGMDTATRAALLRFLRTL